MFWFKVVCILCSHGQSGKRSCLPVAGSAPSPRGPEAMAVFKLLKLAWGCKAEWSQSETRALPLYTFFIFFFLPFFFFFWVCHPDFTHKKDQGQNVTFSPKYGTAMSSLLISILFWKPGAPTQLNPYPCDFNLDTLIISFIIIIVVINIVLPLLNSQSQKWKGPASDKREGAMREPQKIHGEKKSGFSFLSFFFLMIKNTDDSCK